MKASRLMSLLMPCSTPRSRWLLGLLISAGIAPAAADPPAPRGWQLSVDSRAARYQPVGQPAVELMLQRAEAAGEADLPAWFAQRLRAGVPGLTAVEWDAPSPLRPQIWTSMGRTLQGPRRAVSATGCRTPDGLLRFATLTMPPDIGGLREHAQSAATVLQAACTQAGNTALAAAPAAPEAAHPAGASPARSTVNPANALKEADIDSVLYAWQQRYQFDGLKLQEWTYLLLKDGSARDGVPKQAPADFDLAADRRDPEQRWGRWRRAGGSVQVDFGQGWRTPPGQMIRQPGRAGERLAGVYQATSSSTFGDQVALWFNAGIELRADGSYRRWTHRGSAVSSGTGDSKTMSMSHSDDKGTSTSFGGRSFAGGQRSQSGTNDDDLEGRYHIEGWSITLRSRSGKTERAFFFAAAERSSVGLAGAELDRQRPK